MMYPTIVWTVLCTSGIDHGTNTTMILLYLEIFIFWLLSLYLDAEILGCMDSVFEQDTLSAMIKSTQWSNGSQVEAPSWGFFVEGYEISGDDHT